MEFEVRCFTKSWIGSNNCGTWCKNLDNVSAFNDNVCVSVEAVTVAVRIVEENKAISPKKVPCLNVANLACCPRWASNSVTLVRVEVRCLPLEFPLAFPLGVPLEDNDGFFFFMG